MEATKPTVYSENYIHRLLSGKEPSSWTKTPIGEGGKRGVIVSQALKAQKIKERELEEEATEMPRGEPFVNGRISSN